MTFMRKFLELLKLQKNNNTIVSSTYEPMSTIKTVDTATIHKEVTPPQKSQKLSNADFDTFLWQCNSVSEERENESTSDFQMQIDNPNDNLETGYHYAMQDIAKAKEK